ncbi:DEAD/DEAH box helicase [Bradyrhizobium sp. CCBAU 11361]|uniref:DEAD/DEAH box helicase n=1 Tax=Bradyrhizobium sp. CCBAU 11361 TaxID=1630812 RepID=UPI0023027CC8|nr:DEAD/DEAH box helicase family protein [Bradyrhizobium sp. CCBAU 11361]MDA9488844.1 hypothetical protein [Bradyrhizobium sp. CCBAU 11361]
MGIRDLVHDLRTSIDDEVAASVDKNSYGAMVRHLQKYRFWEGAKPTLYEHQRRAIETVAAYIDADPHLPERPNLKEAALLKLPTGTGKSGIVTVLARCLPSVKRTLVLTPRGSLVAQMRDDVRFRFWKHLGYTVNEGQTFTAEASSMGADLQETYVETLLPSRADAILQHVPAANRSILIGTYQALDMIRRRARDPRPERAARAQAARNVLALLAGFDLILVDEGHYEPAISWSKGVRELNRPTVLLSATPYRNDFKSFRVRGQFVFNYPHGDAVAAHVIRDVEPVVVEPRGGGAASDKSVNGLQRQLPALLAQAKAWTNTPKIMIRADDLDTLQSLQRKVDQVFGTKSALVHDRAKGGNTPEGSRAYDARCMNAPTRSSGYINSSLWKASITPTSSRSLFTTCTRTAANSYSKSGGWYERAPGERVNK